MANETNPLHTILSQGTRPDIEASEIQRRAIERHVGRYIVRWGYIDLFLGIAVAAWERGTNPHSSEKVVSKLRTADKIKRLRAAIPDRWVDGQRMLDELIKGNNYRNALAHSNLAMGGQHGGKAYGWHFWNVRGRDVAIELDPSFMASQDLHSEVMFLAATIIMGEHYLGKAQSADLDAISLSDLIIASPGTWETVAHHDVFILRAREMFPPRSKRAA